MRKLFVLLAVIGAAFVVWNRNRLYLRDPMGSLTRDGVKEAGAQIFINYSNDILLENDNAPMYVLLVQRGGRAGVPVTLRCIHYVVCVTNADDATLATVKEMEVDSMSGKSVIFHDDNGRQTIVTLH